MILLIAGECEFQSVRNRYGYEGLTQIGQSELRGLGWDTVAQGPFFKARPEVQMPITARYFAEWRRRLKIPRWESAGHLWACNLAPAHLKRVDGVVYSEMEHAAQYRANKWLDLNRDGVITRDELTRALGIAAAKCRADYELALAGLRWAERERELGVCLAEAPEENAV
jgi:hypothetical protein